MSTPHNSAKPGEIAKIKTLRNVEDAVEIKKYINENRPKEIKIALNTVRQAYAMIQRAGIKAKLSEYEDEDGYTMTIHFPKE